MDTLQFAEKIWSALDARAFFSRVVGAADADCVHSDGIVVAMNLKENKNESSSGKNR